MTTLCRPGRTPGARAESLLRKRFALAALLASHARGRWFETSRAHEENRLHLREGRVGGGRPPERP